jgi:hypothetical protein
MGNDTADQVQDMMKKAGGSAHSIWVRMIGITDQSLGLTTS